ncbi:MAG: sugar porter family MFS transporter [Woeseiaceae bacterium]|nr:sugar porter family MFS transporter [Woeseiaceae bacterium]
MFKSNGKTALIALIVALGGFLMGFDASVIAGVVGAIEVEFGLSKIQLGWSVSSLSLTATLGMLLAGPVSDRLGRRPVLMIAAVLFGLSAVASAIAPDFLTFILARMLGGFGVGAALIVAPMYIAEMSPPELRGRMVSINQLNIVIGISAAFFSNYLILTLGESGSAWVGILKMDDWGWRWMLLVEALPAVVYLLALLLVPESPRWLVMQGRDDEARDVVNRIRGSEQSEALLAQVHESLEAEKALGEVTYRTLLNPSLRLVLTIGLTVGILQQATGINAVFFYAPMIFEQTGVGTNASFMQAVLVGLVNLAFTVVAMMLIDRLGRRPLLGFGLGGIAVCMLVLAYGFGTATYRLDSSAIDALPAEIDRAAIAVVADTTFHSDTEFRDALSEAIGTDSYKTFESDIVSSAIDTNPWLILFAILGFVASFAMSIGPIMWVLFSELFPNRVRGMAISFVGLVNSAVAFLVTLVFPWELETFGNSTTFLIYAAFAIVGLVFIMRILPETKGKSLEELEASLASA